ncbi:MAG: hypothetical protein JNJ45_04475 [Chthonomonas sp.]|nr:hypothetical protein [Chthonomonas sp.]
MELTTLLATIALGGNNKMAAAFAVPELNRIALTPAIDGRLDDEEWDALSETPELKSYLQWEPGALYLASVAPEGKDVVFSLDMDGDGWLVGKNNLEVRLSWADGDVKASCRTLDATRAQEPSWVSAPWIEQTMTARALNAGGMWSVEVKLLPIEIPSFEMGRTIGVRADAFGPGESTNATDLIRRVSPVTMRFDRSRGLPNGMEWEPETLARNVTPSDNFRIRMNFRRPKDAELERVYCRTMGLGRASTVAFEMPFPEFDRKGRSFVDYSTKVARTATHGYRVMETKIRGAQQEDITIQTSYAVRPTYGVEGKVSGEPVMSPDVQVIDANVMVKSYTDTRLRGKISLSLPSGWAAKKGGEANLMIHQIRGVQKLPVKLVVPAGTQGLHTVMVDVSYNGETTSTPMYVLIR